MHQDVKQAFKALNDALLVAMARDETSLEAAKAYATLALVLSGVEDAFTGLIQSEER